MDQRRTRLVAAHSSKYSLRSGVGLIFILLSLMFGLIVAQSLLSPVERLARDVAKQQGAETPEEREELRREVLDQIVDQARPAVAWVLGSSSVDKIEDETERVEAREDYEEWTSSLLDDKPALLSAILLVLLWGWPFVVAVGAFDLVSSDVGSRRIRYQLLRVDRSSIFFGRLFGTVLTFIAVLVMLLGVVVLYMGLKLPYYEMSDLISWGAYGGLCLVVVSLPYIALCSWISATVSSAMASLTLSVLVIGGIPLFSVLGGQTSEHADKVLYLLPWGTQSHLFHHDTTLSVGAMLGCLGYTALFTFLGHRKFVTRDL
ncbi:MAG: hypothetical protein AAF196_05305 [Planctomycetota bacterium]